MTRPRQLSVAALAGLLATLSLRCSGNNLQPPTASAIAAVSGSGQSGPVGSTLADPLVVLVTDGSGEPVQGVQVQWAVQGDGSVSEAETETGTNGRASVGWTLGPTAGEQTATATVSGLEGSPVTFTATATDGTTPTLAMKTQPSASAQSGVALAVQPVVQLKDGVGNDQAQSGLSVTVSLATGTGTLSGTLTRQTDGTGAAAFTDLAITGAAGSFTLRFTAPGTAPVQSSAVTIGAAAGGVAITTNPPTSALSGEVFDPVVQPVIQVTDANGGPAAGVQVTATVAPGSGTLEGATTATSDAAGAARFGDLGIRGPGTYTLEFTAGGSSVGSSSIEIRPLPSEATSGKWGPMVEWPIVPLHMSLLPTGKVIGWGKYEDGGVMGTHATIPRLWDPATPGSFKPVQADTMLFCAGHTLMADGRLMVSGGHKADDVGIDVTNIFDPATESWVPGLPKMAFGRWYPTVTTLADGRVLTMAGRDSAGKVVTTPEIWENGAWVKLPGAGTLEIPYYPRNFVAPNGLIFMAGERVQSRWFDVDGSAAGGRGKWTSGPTHIWPFNRDYGTAAMYEPGKILFAGGGGNKTWGQTPDARAAAPTATAEKIDLNAGSPAWTSAGSMAFARRHTNSTILPDGTVLVTGGTTGGGFVDINPADAARAAEVWDPKTNQWTTLAANSVMRVYHSVSLLLPDGTVLHGASGNALAGTSQVPDENNHEIFSPPYLFKGARPTITSAPTSVSYGQSFAVATPNAAQVTDVRWIRLGSVTHAFDMSQRANTLAFTRTPTGITVTAPANAKLAPPGHYLLFVLNRNGVPSAGKIVHVQP